MDNLKVLINENELNNRIKDIANQIKNDYRNEEVVFCCVLKGAAFFTTDLMKRYGGIAELQFIRVSSYDGEDSTGNIELKISLKRENVENKNIIIVEDIVDSGRTLNYLLEYVKTFNPKSVRSCVLLDKKARRVIDFNADYVGFDIDDLFVIGYGLDYNERYRNLPYIGYLEK